MLCPAVATATVPATAPPPMFSAISGAALLYKAFAEPPSVLALAPGKPDEPIVLLAFTVTEVPVNTAVWLCIGISF